MRNRAVLISVLVGAVMCLSAGTVVADKYCKQVNATFEFGPILLDPDCMGFDLCQTAYLAGTPNGTMWTFANWDGFIFWADGTIINVAESVIETAHGEIYSADRAIIAPGAPDGFVQHSNVTGGTGRYEGATGWLALFAEVENNKGLLRGEICYAED